MVEKHPVEASRGANNAYYFACDVIGQRPAYCICVNKVHAYDQGREDFWPDCVTALKRHTCPARAMLEEEEAAEKAIYFIKRETIHAPTVDRSVVSPQPPTAARVEPIKKAPVAPVVPKITAPDYGDAINKVVARELAEKPVPKSVTPPPPVQGESLLEMAKRMMSAATAS